MTQPSPLASPLPWDLVANAYDAELRGQFEALAKQVLAAVGAAAGRDRDVLDVATGPGTLAVMAAGEGARLTAIDFSPEMVERARANATSAGVTIDFHVADAAALPFSDASFDAAFALFVVMFLPDRARGIAELTRVLRPGGRAAVTTWVPMNRSPLIAAMMDALSVQIPGLPPNDGTAPLGTTDELAEALRAAGLADIEAREITYDVEIPSTAAFWEGAQRTTAPLVLMQKRMGAIGWAPVARAVGDALEKRFGAGPQTLPLVANLAIGTRR